MCCGLAVDVCPLLSLSLLTRPDHQLSVPLLDIAHCLSLQPIKLYLISPLHQTPPVVAFTIALN